MGGVLELQQGELRAFHAEAQIATEAWSPLAQGGDFLSDPTIGEIAEAHGKSVAQVILRWHVQLGNVVSAAVLDAIAGLDRGERVGPDVP